MYRVRQQDLPFKGSSHHFVGADNGDVNATRPGGRSPQPAVHPGRSSLVTPREARSRDRVALRAARAARWPLPQPTTALPRRV